MDVPVTAKAAIPMVLLAASGCGADLREAQAGDARRPAFASWATSLPVSTATGSVTARPHPSGIPAKVSSGPSRVALGAGLGVVTVGVGAGLGMIIRGFDQKREADDFRDDLWFNKGGHGVCGQPAFRSICMTFEDTYHSSIQWTTAGVWTLVGAGAVSVGTIFYAILKQAGTPLR